MQPPRIAIVSDVDLSPELCDTVLWRAGFERVSCPSPALAFATILELGPRLAVVDASDTAAACDLIQQLRSNDRTRALSVAALSRSGSLEDEARLRGVGANVVLSGHVDAYRWDGRLEALLCVPRRRELRLPVRFEVWSRFDAGANATQGSALNVSLKGALVETEELLDLGSKLDIAFTLPDGTADLKAFAQVVREMGEVRGRHRMGVEFLLLRGDARKRLAAFIGEPAGS